MAASANKFSQSVNLNIKAKPKNTKAETKQTKPPAKNDITKEEKKVKKVSKTKKGVGRPSKGYGKVITLYVKEELVAGLETGATIKHKGNITAHLNELIEQDIRNNEQLYNSVQNLANKSK